MAATFEKANTYVFAAPIIRDLRLLFAFAIGKRVGHLGAQSAAKGATLISLRAEHPERVAQRACRLLGYTPVKKAKRSAFIATAFSARIVEKVERAHVLPQSIEMTASERAQRHFTPHKANFEMNTFREIYEKRFKAQVPASLKYLQELKF